MSDNSKAAGHWNATRNLTILVLILWFIFAFVVHWFAKDLNSINFLGFELGYWFAVQGSPLIFVLLIFFHNWRQDSIDSEYGFDEDGGRD